MQKALISYIRYSTHTFICFIILNISLTNYSYSQINLHINDSLNENFDAIGIFSITSLPNYWRISSNINNLGNGSYNTAESITQFKNDTINSFTSGGRFNFGRITLDSLNTTLPNLPELHGYPYDYQPNNAINNSTDRAIGEWIRNAINVKSTSIIVPIRNVDTIPFNGLKISYSLEKYKNGKCKTQIVLKNSSDGNSNWNYLDSNLIHIFNADSNVSAIIPAPSDSIIISNNFSLLNLNPGQVSFISWNFLYISDSTSTDGGTPLPPGLHGSNQNESANGYIHESEKQAIGLDNVSIIPVAKPSIKTLTCSNQSTYSITVHGNIISINGDLVSERGFIIYEADGTDKEIGSVGVTQYSETGLYNIGQYSHTFNNLCPGKTYSIRAYAKNVCGITYGSRTECTPNAEVLILSSNSPICQGGTLILQASSISNAMYHWNGPIGFSSTSQNVSISSFSTTGNFTYSCYYTLPCGYTSPTSSITITVEPTPNTPNIYHD